ncbi:MAG: VWA domain-containing protein [Campylobacterota bacterium]|nr:VWA domain-containing protein [Campylobacterota bacterium]
MSLLYPAVLWLLISLLILFYYRPKKLTDTVHLIILLLLTIAMARPVMDQKPEETQIEAQDIIIALDVSYSMRADDIAPNRYDYAKETINALLKSNVTDNIMLIAFTSNPLLLSPPTTDHELISIALESLDPDNILTHGTSLEKLFTKLSALPIPHKNLILMTDGGDENKVSILNSIIRDSAISLTVLALGTKQGTTIKKQDGTLLKDAQGELVISRINPMLETLAAQNYGTYITPSATPSATAEDLQESIDEHQRERSTITKMQHHYLELYQIPLLLAALLFLMLHTRAVKLIIILTGLFGAQASASIFDAHYLHQAYAHYHQGDFNATEESLARVGRLSLQSQMALAGTYYKQERYQKALAIYRSIRTTSPMVKQMLNYNIGNCYARQELYDKAKRYYTKALQLGDDADTRHNMELIATLKSKQKSKLGVAHPKSQSGSSGKSEGEEDEAGKKSKDPQSSGSGGGGQSKTKSKEQKRVIQQGASKKQPLSSKVYDLINKGYIHEKQPW